MASFDVFLDALESAVVGKADDSSTFATIGTVSGLGLVPLTMTQTIKNEVKRVSGYARSTDIQAVPVRTVTIPQNFAGLEAVDVPTRLAYQFFEIVDVVEEENEVIITARHDWYRNLQNYTLWKPEEGESYSASEVCKNVMDNAISPVSFEVATDCTDTLPAKELDFERKNLVEAFLDPENGICKKFGLSLIRDGRRFYCLKNVGYDRGFVVESGKNLLGVERQENIENLATRVVPMAKDNKGGIVWLNDNGKKYVDSQYINNYREPRIEMYDTGLQIGKNGVTAQNVQQKLKEAAQKRFSEDKVDIPDVTMTIEFISLGDTEEYKQYRDLDKVYLYDILTVKDPDKGYNYSAQVIGVEHDILTGRLNSVTIGMLRQADASRKIAVWQVPEISGENIRLMSIQAGSFAEGVIFGSDIAEHVIEYVHIASATIDSLNADAITAITAQIENIIAGHITADSIKTSAINAINAKLGIASIADAEIANASIGFAQIKTATAESLIARDAVTDRYFIDKLQVRNVQAVQATVGDLVVKASNGYYYRLDVGTDGSLAPTRVYPTSSAIAEGRMGNGAIIETDLTVAELSASNMKAINALIDKITASRIDVDELFARSAFINKLNTTDISSNTYLQLMVNSKNKTYRQWATPTDAHNGDVWYKQGPQPISEMQNYTHAQLAQFPYWAFNGYQLYIYENNTWRKVEDEAEVRSTIAQILLQNNRIDLMVAQLDTEMDNKYTVRSGIAIELAGIEISGSKYVRIKSGGKFIVDSGNFSIDENGNVVMSGTITALAGKIGGFNIGATRLSSGSGANFICLDSGTASFDYFIMAGGTSATDAKFLLTKNGELTVESLTIRNEQGTATQQIDLSNYALWKLNYNVVKSYTANSITLSNGAVINFNTAAGVVLSGGWEDDGGRRYTAIAKDGNNQEVARISSGTVEIWLGHSIANRQNVKSALESSSAHIASVTADADGVALTDGLVIDASGVYNQGWSAAVSKVGSLGVTAGSGVVAITVPSSDVGGTEQKSGTITLSQGSWSNGSKLITANFNGSQAQALTVDVGSSSGWSAAYVQNGLMSVSCFVAGKAFSSGAMTDPGYSAGVKNGNNDARSNQTTIGTCYEITAHSGEWVKVRSLGTGYSRVPYMS